MARVLLLGATGTAGTATAKALVNAGHSVVALVRKGAKTEQLPGRIEIRAGDIGTLDPGETFDVLVSCLASRTGAPKNAWAVDFEANKTALDAARALGVGHFILLSAICVQKPLLEFQRAKLAIEKALIESGLRYSIVRPTAFFKSLSGQIARVRDGKPYLMFGNGALTACKPISDRDLGTFIVGCIEAEDRWNAVLPIGGPGPALTPRDMAGELFRLTGHPPKTRHVPLSLLDAVIGVLSVLGRVNAGMAEKAELAKIGRYYATESMLVFDPRTQRYDADATPEFGEDGLFDHYARVISGEESVDLGDHAVF